MSEPRIQSPALLIRTALFINAIRRTSGAGLIRIERAVAECAYTPFGFSPPSFEVVREYFTLRRTPAIDPPDKSAPSWLMAANLTYPGTAYAFFHPLSDLLFGRIESTVKRVLLAERIPKEWIEDAYRRGRKDEANSYIAYNSELDAKRGRPKALNPNRLSFLHMTMLKLREPCRTAIFHQPFYGGSFARRYRPIPEIDQDLASAPPADRTAAMLGLFFEACELGDATARLQARRAARRHLHALLKDRGLARIRQLLREVMFSSEGLQWPEVRDYTIPAAYRAGLPVSWVAKINAIDINLAFPAAF